VKITSGLVSLILLMTELNWVWPSGKYSSPTTFSFRKFSMCLREILFDVQHRLAGGRGPAAHDRGDLVVDQKLLGLFGEGRPVRGAVFLNDLDLAAEHAAHCVDLLNGELFGLDRSGFRDRHRARCRVQDADRNFGVGHRQSSGVHGGRRRPGTERWTRKQRHGRQRRHSHQHFSPEWRM
jgi:hypothetical protein